MVSLKKFINLKQYKKQALFMFAVTAAAIVGGASTALVQAAIPTSTNGQVTACYLKIGGTVRFVDSEGGTNCNGLENTVTLTSGQAHPISFVALNDDGTLNSSYSSGVTSMSLVQVPGSDPATYSICLVLPYTPKFAYSHVGYSNVPVARGNPTDSSRIDDNCGSSYNAAILNPTQPYSAEPSTIFLN